MQTKQEQMEQEQQAHEDALNEQAAANGGEARVNYSEPVRDPKTGALVFPAGEVLEIRENALVIALPKGRKAKPLDFKRDQKTGKWSVPKSYNYTYFAYNIGGARLSVSLTVPIPDAKREVMYQALVAKVGAAKVEPLEERKNGNRISVDAVLASHKATDGGIL